MYGILKEYLGTSASDRFTLLPEKSKKINKIYDTVVFKTLDIMWWIVVIPEKWETNEVSSYLWPSLLPWERFQATMQEGGTQVELGGFLEKRWDEYRETRCIIGKSSPIQ